MKLYARRSSSNSQKVLWFLGELGIEYAFVAAGGDAGGLDAPEYLAMNPNGMVPTLADGAHVVWESHSILRYLAAAHGAAKFWPEDPAKRSVVDRWMDWSQSQFDPAFMALFWGHWRTPEAKRNEKLNRTQAKRCRHFLEILDAVLGNRDFVAGREFSLADVPVGTLMYRYVNLDVTADAPPNVAAWYRRLEEREPFREHVMLPFDDLKGRLAH